VIQRESKMENYTSVSEEKTGIISMVRDLEEQVETAFNLKATVQAELNAAKKKLFEQLAARAKLEKQVESLQAQVALVEKLRNTIRTIEKERNEFDDLLASTRKQLDATRTERNSLLEKATYAQTKSEELDEKKTAFEIELMDIKDKLSTIESLNSEIAEITQAHREVDKKVRNLTACLKDSEASENALEQELAQAGEATCSLDKQVTVLREKLTDTGRLIADLRVQLEDHQDVNRELVETRTHLEGQMKTLNVNYEATRNELKAFRKVLREIRSETKRTTEYARHQHFVK